MTSLRRALPFLIMCAACGGGGSTPGAGGDAAADDASAHADAPGAPDGAVASTCPDLARTFALPRLDAYSNVCVDQATCTFAIDDAATCTGSVTCAYQGAGQATYPVDFEPTADGAWAARIASGNQVDEFVYRAGHLAYRFRGDVTDRRLCVFSDGGPAPAFLVHGGGVCPDLTRAYAFDRDQPQLCADTLICGLFQHDDDGCRVDGFCTYPTGQTKSFPDVAVTPSSATAALVVGDLTTDPSFVERYELTLGGDFAAGAGAATAAHLDWYFNDDPGSPTCAWTLTP